MMISITLVISHALLLVSLWTSASASLSSGSVSALNLDRNSDLNPLVIGLLGTVYGTEFATVSVSESYRNSEIKSTTGPNTGTARKTSPEANQDDRVKQTVSDAHKNVNTAAIAGANSDVSSTDNLPDLGYADLMSVYVLTSGPMPDQDFCCSIKRCTTWSCVENYLAVRKSIDVDGEGWASEYARDPEGAQQVFFYCSSVYSCSFSGSSDVSSLQGNAKGGLSINGGISSRKISNDANTNITTSSGSSDSSSSINSSSGSSSTSSSSSSSITMTSGRAGLAFAALTLVSSLALLLIVMFLTRFRRHIYESIAPTTNGAVEWEGVRQGDEVVIPVAKSEDGESLMGMGETTEQQHSGFDYAQV
jgi:hypothetical protein